MTEQQPDFLDWVDRIQIEVRIVDYLDRPPTEVWIVDMYDPPFTRDEPARVLLEAAEALQEKAEGFALDVRRKYTSWGADGSFWQLILYLSGAGFTGIVGNAAYDALKSLVATAKDRASELPPKQEMSRDEAIERAKWHVRTSFELPAEASLEQVTDTFEAESGTWILVLHDSESIFSVELSNEHGLAWVVRISRQKRD